VLGSQIVVRTEVYVELLELITVRQWTFGDVQNIFRVFIDPEDQGLSGIFDRPADLHNHRQNVTVVVTKLSN